MRKFEKISLDEFHKEFGKDKDNFYNDLIMPKRGSKYSAGYDIVAPWDIVVKPKATEKIPTLLKVSMEDDEVVLIDVRSSLGFKHNVRLANTIAIIDKDYYNCEENEGHIFIKLYNPNTYNIFFNAGDRIAQAIFTKYLITDDDMANEDRKGGIGSTGK